MKVKIGPYTNWFGPYQLAEKILFWKSEDDETVDKFGEWLAHGSIEPELNDHCEDQTFWQKIENDEERHKTLLYRFLLWIEEKNKRKIKVHIDDYDLWSMDETLGYIILPMSKRLKEIKHGHPYVHKEDVPDTIPSDAPDGWSTTEQWDWVLDEMIYAFEFKSGDNSDWEDKFSDYSREEYEKTRDRIQNGFRLFGKYYQALWD
jgi:hypothetical protein